MKTILRVLPFTVLCFIIFSSGTVWANVPVDIQKQIEANFEDHKEGLENNKAILGLSKDETFKEAKLGKGYPVYILKPQSSRNELALFAFDGYIFPIRTGEKSAGIVFANQVDGKWQITGGTSNTAFEDEVKAALKDNKENDSVKIIYDSSIRLYAVYYLTNEGETIIPFRDSGALGLEKHISMKVQEVKQSIDNYERRYQHHENEQEGGGAAANEQSFKSPIFMALAAGMLIVGGLLIFTRKKRTTP